MYKIVLQVPELESEVFAEPWQETSDPHGPHVKVYKHQSCSETGAPMTIVRCKHRTLEEVQTLMSRVIDGIESL